MKTHHFKQVVNDDGTITLSGLPPYQEVAIVVLYLDPDDWLKEMKQLMQDLQQDHPFAQMSKKDILEKLRQTRAEVYKEVC